MGPVIFTKIVNRVAIIHSINSNIDISNHITISQSQANYCIISEYVVLGGLNAKLTMIGSNFSVVFYAANDHDKYNSILYLFQYKIWTTPIGRPITTEPQDHQHNYSIVLQDNIYDMLTNKLFSISHCDWMEESFFTQSDPIKVNEKIIHYVNNSMAVEPVKHPNVACYCIQMTNITTAPLMSLDQCTLDKHLL